MSTVAEIRKLTKDLLVAANIAGGNVVNSKYTPTSADKAPMVNVYADKVSLIQQGATRPAFTSSITLQIDVLVKLNETWADAADAIVGDILSTLMSNTEWVDQWTIENGQVGYEIVADETCKIAIAGLAQITIIGTVFKAY